VPTLRFGNPVTILKNNFASVASACDVKNLAAPAISGNDRIGAQVQ
jgi:hypothetical protein